MTDFAIALADLRVARARRDTRAIHAAEQALKRATTAQLRREVEQRRGRPFWRKLWGRG